jgi:hypothetical protein
MALPAITGQLDTELGIVTPTNTGTWSDLAGTAWVEYTSWPNNPANPMVWIADLVQVPFTTPYNLRIETDAQGTVSYDVYTSDSGLFAGEETVTTIANGATSVGSFTGRNVYVVIKVTNTGLPTVLRNVVIRASDFSVDINVRADTSLLSGSAGNRTVPLPRTISGIVNMTVSPEAVTAYTPDVYVTDISTTQLVHAMVTDTSFTAPKIGVFGWDGLARDAVVNVKIKALPQQRMQGNNLISQ